MSALPSPQTTVLSIPQQFHNRIIIFKRGGGGVRKFICIQDLYHYRDDKQNVTAEVWHVTKINMKYDETVRPTTGPCLALTSHFPSLDIGLREAPDKLPGISGLLDGNITNHHRLHTTLPQNTVLSYTPIQWPGNRKSSQPDSNLHLQPYFFYQKALKSSGLRMLFYDILQFLYSCIYPDVYDGRYKG